MERTCKKCNKTGPVGPRNDGITTFHPKQGNTCRQCLREYDTARRIRIQNEGGEQHEKRKEVMRLASAVRKFGLTHEEARALYAHTACWICGGGNRGKKLNIDHCHATCKIRGALCNRCNRGIGFFLDSEELLFRAVAYLRGYFVLVGGDPMLQAKGAKP